MNMEHISDTVNRKVLLSQTVNSDKEYISTVNSRTVASKIDEIIDQSHTTPEGIAKMLAEGLDDQKSERYYFILATENLQSSLLEALSITKDADHRNVIKTKKATYFQGILRRWGLKTRFRQF